MSTYQRCTGFIGDRLIASGPLREVALAARSAARDPTHAVVIFDDRTGEPIEIDLRGTADDVRERLALTTPPAEPPRKPGRPRLGVVAREVTLLPRHWEWLGAQPGGASVALRKLVDQARHAHAGQDRIRQSRDATYRFMSIMAGDFPGFEEATRALFAGARERFERMIAPWPLDIREHALRLAMAAFECPPADALLVNS
jgi:uncharacterized protein